VWLAQSSLAPNRRLGNAGAVLWPAPQQQQRGGVGAAAMKSGSSSEEEARQQQRGRSFSACGGCTTAAKALSMIIDSYVMQLSGTCDRKRSICTWAPH